jgi:DNA-binding transcriptional regulator YdaS (Cro superfamily)
MDGRKLLAAFIRANPASQAKLARDAGCSEGHLSLILSGKRWASPKLAHKISRAIDGAVPAKELVSPRQHEAAYYLRAG